jgi:tRNA(adenine34) deaminase
MWNELSPVWQATLEEAWQARCAGCMPIGAVITTAEDRIVARGRNQIYEPRAVSEVVQGNQLAHAEVNALLALDLNGLDRHSLHIYTTMEPCPLCMGAIYMSGLRTVHFAARDPYAGSANLLGTTPYLQRKPVRALGPEDPELERILMGLYAEFHFRKFGERHDKVMEAWLQVRSEGVCLGEELFRSGRSGH